MLAEDVEGLTAEQIRDKFALPQVPKWVCDVDVPSNISVNVSIVGEIQEWGSGGPVQLEILGTVQKEWFTNIRVLNE